MVLVDPPGYGHAVGNKREINSWAKLLSIYVRNSKCLHRILILIDGKQGLNELDKQFISFLGELGKPFLVCLTKVDTASEQLLKKNVEDVQKFTDGMICASPFIHLTSSK